LFENAKISPSFYGVVQIPIFGSFILGNFVLRKMTYTRSLKQIVQIGFPICIAALVLQLAWTWYDPDSFWSLVVPLSLFCLGGGIIGAPITRLSLYSTSAGKGTASAVHGLVSSIVLILAVSFMPLVFHGKNVEFGWFGFATAIITGLICGRFLSLLNPKPLFENSQVVVE
jgi:DHA1 family multidrug/chloramphenicol efflux transport protein-like MFS transporter